MTRRTPRHRILAPWLAAALLAGCSTSPPPVPQPSATRATNFQEGVPGGVVVETVEINARVVSIDHAQRTAVLRDSEGAERPIRVGPDAVNFSQVEKGDLVTAVLTREVIIGLAGENAQGADGAAGLVALAPVGAAPGGVMAKAVRVTGTVTAIDHAARTATLRFADGSSRTLAVRPDIDLEKHSVGEAVTLQVTESVAIKVFKP